MFLDLANYIAVKAYAEHECSKLFVLLQTKCVSILNSKAMSCSHCFGTALR